MMNIEWVDGSEIRVSIEHGEAVISANREGLLSLARQLTALAEETPGSHIVLAGPGRLNAEGFAGDIGLTGAGMLEEVDRLTPGNLMILGVLDRTMVYQVEWVQTMSPEGLERMELAQETDTDLLTLVTERKERRLVVRGRRIPTTEAH